MASVELYRNSFAAGELSPKLEGRDDVSYVQSGCKLLENARILPHGGVVRREGTMFIGEVKDSSRTTRLIPFQPAAGESYIIEAGHLYFRFWTENGIVVDGSNNIVEVPTNWHDYEVESLRFAQSNDVMYIVHPAFEPAKLFRNSPTSFTLQTVTWKLGQAPLDLYDSTGAFITLSGINDDVSPATATLTINNYTSGTRKFTAADVGAFGYAGLFGNGTKYDSSGDYRGYNWAYIYFQITAVTGDYTATVGIANGDGQWTDDSTKYDVWAMQLMAPGSGQGCNFVTFWQGRLIYGGFSERPNRLAMSVSDDYDSFDLGTTDTSAATNANDDRAIYRTTASSARNDIYWLAGAGTNLIIGTSASEFQVSGASGLATPNSTAVRQATNRGSINATPALVDNQVFYIQRSGRKVRQFIYQLDNDGYVSKDISIISDHLTQTGLKSLTYQQDPNSVLWALRDDGQIVGWTAEREQEVIGAHRHILGGSYNGGIAQVLDITTVSALNQQQDRLWMLVRRTINGVTRQYIEVMAPEYEPGVYEDSTDADRRSIVKYAIFVDSALILSSPSPVTTISGLGHLEGETVSVLVDGKAQANKAVSGGSITLDWEGFYICVGLPYRTRIETMRPIIPLRSGSAMTKQMRIDSANVKFYKTVGGYIGTGIGEAQKIPNVTAASYGVTDEATELFSGDISIPLYSRSEKSDTIYFEQTEPYPMGILGILYSITVGET